MRLTIAGTPCLAAMYIDTGLHKANEIAQRLLISMCQNLAKTDQWHCFNLATNALFYLQPRIGK